MAPILSTLSAFTLLSSLALATASTGERIGKRDVTLPFLDYASIETASSEAVSEGLRRRGLLDDVVDVERRSAAPKCQTITKRKEWRTLTKDQKKSYINAVKCLTTKDDFGISPISDKLYDAFTYIHENNWFAFHGCAPFAPWHRWFVWLREVTMKEVCGYNGPFPYWNYTLDYKDPFSSPIFSTDSQIGFGTHGKTPYSEIPNVWGFKVDNGAFANLRVALPEAHYLTRNFSLWKDANKPEWGVGFGEWYSPSYVKKTLNTDSFWNFTTLLDGLGQPLTLGVHNGPHFANNGDWSGPAWLAGTKYYPFASTAPNDPMFFPHHAYVDAVFWKWQQQSGKQWLYNGSKNISDYSVLDAKLTDILPFSGFGPDVSVALTLKTENWPLCYTYDF